MASWKKVLTDSDKSTGGVADNETGLVTGDQVYDYIVAQNFGSGSGDITSVVVTADDTNTVGSATGDANFTIAGGEGIDTTASGSTLTIAAEDSSASNKGVVIVAAGEGIDVSYSLEPQPFLVRMRPPLIKVLPFSRLLISVFLMQRFL